DEILHAALEKLIQLSKEDGRMYLIFIENLHELFRQFDTAELQKLRSIFQRYDIFSVVASSPMIFPGISEHDEPFYGFFGIQHLREFSRDEITTLILKIAEVEGNRRFIEEFKQYEERIHGMVHLTGGSPRLVILFYEMITRGELEDTEKAFFKIIDEHTPYYQEVFQLLTGQRRRLFDILIAAGAPVTPKQIAERSRISDSTVVSQLRRLEKDGYVISRREGRHTYYEVRERLFRLWREMRQPFGRKRVSILLEFLQLWYTPKEREGIFKTKFDLLEAGERAALRDLCYYAEIQPPGYRAEALLRLTPKLMEFGELEEAAHAIQELKSIASQSGDGELEWETWQYEAKLRFSEGKYEDALESLDKALEINPKDDFVLSRKGAALGMLGRYEDALEAFDKALEINPKDDFVLSRKGFTLEMLGRYEDALESLDKALEINPKDDFVLSRKGAALGMLGRYEDALEAFDKALEINPKDDFVLSRKGFTLEMLGRYEDALEAYDKTLDINPDAGLALSRKGAALSSLDRYEDALDAFDKALEINPKDDSVLSEKGGALFSLGRYEDALKAFDKALEINPKNEDALFRKGLALLSLDRYEDALKACDKALEINSENEFALSEKGLALFSLGRYEDALKAFDKALEINSENEFALSRKGFTLLKLKRYAEALDASKSAMDVATNESSKIHAALISIEACVSLDRRSDAALEIEKIKDKISEQESHLIEDFVEVCLNLALGELKTENRGNATRLMKMAHDAGTNLEDDRTNELTMTFIKDAVKSGDISVTKAAVDEVIKLYGDRYRKLLNPVIEAIGIVETGDTKRYYSLQVEEREMAADIVRKITGSDELLPS
ncbi:MAG: tetratricopeptide repeat protein, partial [Methanosarcinales archaeon]|nr:tetratricopeptide repeat protein [Methanosarcinales archaeon]